jgi:hypothetical protein
MLVGNRLVDPGHFEIADALALMGKEIAPAPVPVEAARASARTRLDDAACVEWLLHPVWSRTPYEVTSYLARQARGSVQMTVAPPATEREPTETYQKLVEQLSPG